MKQSSKRAAARCAAGAAFLVVSQLIVACSVEPEEVADLVEDGAADEALESAESPMEANCAILQSCNARGSGGTQCLRQENCTCAAAKAECSREAAAVCGSMAHPIIIVGC